ELVAKGASRLILGHLSQENNSPKMAYEAVEKTLKTAGLSCGVDFTLDVAPVVTQGKYIII
ncbi:metal-dependent hydrolase, partial [[Eubacterium] siraeum]|nr:metal-dependent hydrolase [[Eubacterium] siraeum]